MLTPRDASRECISPPQWGPWASGHAGLHQALGLGSTSQFVGGIPPMAHGTPLPGGEYSREEAR